MAGRTKKQFHEAALRVIERMDSDITPEEIERMKAVIRSENEAKTRANGHASEQRVGRTATPAKVAMLPFGIGKEKPQ